MRFLPLCLFTVTAQMVHVGTSCVRLSSCLDDHEATVLQFFKEYPGKYEYIETFLDYTFITTTYYIIKDEYSGEPRLPEIEPPITS